MAGDSRGARMTIESYVNQVRTVGRYYYKSTRSKDGNKATTYEAKSKDIAKPRLMFCLVIM